MVRVGRIPDARTVLLVGMLCLPLVNGCSEPLDEVWQLNAYRVLGVKEDPPESHPGDTVHFTLVSADIRTRTATTIWYLCPQRLETIAAAAGGDGGVSGAFSGCPGGVLRTGPEVDFTAPPAGNGTTDLQGREGYTVLGYSCAGSIRLPTDSHPMPQCVGTDASATMFQRTLYLRNDTPPNVTLNPQNHNPTMTAIHFGTEGGPMPEIASDLPPIVPRCTDTQHHTGCTHWHFEVEFSGDSREPYREPDALTGAITDRVERITVAYLISAGSLESGFRSDSVESPSSTMPNNWWAPDTAQTVTVWVYGHDGRGGFNWISRQIVVQ